MLTGYFRLHAHLPSLSLPDRWRDRLPSVVQALLIALLALQAIRIGWLLAVPPAPVGEAGGVELQAAPLASADGLDPFFPQQQAQGAVADGSGLVLFGVRTGADGGSAILGEAGGTQASYAVGETVKPGVTVAAIGVDHVVLQANGARSRLPFAAARAAAPASALPSALPAAAPASEPVDPAAFLAQAGLRPRMEGDRANGYTLVPRGDSTLLRQAGLQAGDVILSVNGQALTPEHYEALAEELGDASSIDITYQRDGDIRTTSMQAKPP
ncbi:MAG TPA: type II secretion system protein N [Pseudoxanthomonas sp.]|nr:type II secretion system protein N [Pseudoxanthomonas sp.]